MNSQGNKLFNKFKLINISASHLYRKLSFYWQGTIEASVKEENKLVFGY